MTVIGNKNTFIEITADIVDLRFMSQYVQYILPLAFYESFRVCACVHKQAYVS